MIGFYADSLLTRSGLGYAAVVKMIVEKEERALTLGKCHGANVMRFECESSLAHGAKHMSNVGLVFIIFSVDFSSCASVLRFRHPILMCDRNLFYVSENKLVSSFSVRVTIKDSIVYLITDSSIIQAEGFNFIYVLITQKTA